jgi:hypothetical protein
MAKPMPAAISVKKLAQNSIMLLNDGEPVAMEPRRAPPVVGGLPAWIPQPWAAVFGIPG